MAVFITLNLSKVDGGLNSNVLKIIAAVTMLIDHIGVILFPSVTFLRIIGRLSFPIYAFMISEGCTHTKNKLRYFLNIFSLGVVCQIAVNLQKENVKMGILITFSVSILTIYALQYMKNTLFLKKSTSIKKYISVCIFIFVIVGVYFLNKYVRIDYGFWGCLTPLFASVFKQDKKTDFLVFEKLNNKYLHLVCLSIGLLLLAIKLKGIQCYSLFAILILLFYSGKRGNLKMKYFFYVFYPLHLVILEGISYFLF